MDKFFDTVLTDKLDAGTFFLCLGVAIATGVMLAFMTYYRSRSSKSFFITTALLPAAVATIIILINGNIGAGITVAGAFTLVRFRSAQGTAKEICIIFVAMVAGLAYGMGYLAYGAIFSVVAGACLMLCTHFRLWERKPNAKEKTLRITIPEDLDYTTVFDELFNKYTVNHELIQAKSADLGSVFRLTYNLTLKDPAQEKAFIDDLRVRNGNLEISLGRAEYHALADL